ncbi:protein cereblon-like [Physella acuta]|uniref:protein cereblon-like n=1 Tax=Physella acuta TaxID=109671 RepID=UPI0027DB434F|nr:protein cereblon-like [Physella acuta]
MASSWKVKFVPFAASALELLWTICLVQILVGVACSQYDEFEGYLLCRKCGYEIAKAQHLFSMPSSLALRQRNDTIANSDKVLIQLFKNPQGIYFELITSLESELETEPQRYASDSWFPGYAWSIAKCPKCGSHLGWSFTVLTDVLNSAESQLSSFFGLILDKIMHENDVNNLIALPKTYAS